LKIEKRDLFGLVSVLTRCSFLLLSLLLFISCGKKGPPTIKAYEKPQAPSGLTAYHREDKMILAWSYPDNLRSSLTGFEVLRSEKDGFEKIGSVKNSQSSFADETFKLDITCNYKVVAQNLKGVSSNDSNIITVTPIPVPATPEDIRFAAKADSVALSWKSSEEGACYNIYKTAEKGKYGESPLNKAPVCATSFTDGTVSPERSVYYAVRALRMTDVRDEGSASEELEVSPSQFVPSAPSDLRVVKGDKIYLMWKESPDPWVRGYRVYRKIDGEKEFILLNEVKPPMFTDTEKINKKVWYMIKAVGPATESEPLVGEVVKK
jgi:fibronectin type 3 domain-containing protein